MARWTTVTCLSQQRLRWSAFIKSPNRRWSNLKRAGTKSTNSLYLLKRTSISWYMSRRFSQRNSQWSRMSYWRANVRSCKWKGKSWSSTMSKHPWRRRRRRSVRWSRITLVASSKETSSHRRSESSRLNCRWAERIRKSSLQTTKS